MRRGTQTVKKKRRRSAVDKKDEQQMDEEENGIATIVEKVEVSQNDVKSNLK